MTSVRNTVAEQLGTNVLVIGSGLAGLLTALDLTQAGISVVLACKGALSDSNTTYAQGGLAASLPANRFDSPELHLEDTLKAGCGLVDPLVAQTIVFAGSALAGELIRLGVAFDFDDNGGTVLAREGGHSRSRILHSKDATGRSITSALIARLQEAASANNRLLVLEHTFAQSLIVEDKECFGANFDVGGRRLSVFARQTVLATGGLGQVYARTTNPAVATGDGIAAAYRAGATLADMEFVQFHPTVLVAENAPAFLITEAVRGAGAILLDQNGDRFMDRFHSDLELATRDVIARAIHTVMLEQNQSSVFLDLRPIGQQKLLAQFPNVVQTCRQYGIDPLSQPIPISPAAHYFMGGILTDIDGNSSIRGLSAIGECAAVGLHGANRLASNSLLEAGVMAIRVCNYLFAQGSIDIAKPIRFDKYRRSAAPHLMAESLSELREQMFRNVGLVKDKRSLSRMLKFLSKSKIVTGDSSRQASELSNLTLLSQLITQSALIRQESRGAHLRNDFPQSNERFAQRLTVRHSEYRWLSDKQELDEKEKVSPRKLVAAGN